MTKKQILAEIEAHLKATFGVQFTPELFKLAKAKAVRWQKKAYGESDWVGHYGESGAECIDGYFRECLEKPNAKDSFNRQTVRSRYED